MYTYIYIYIYIYIYYVIKSHMYMKIGISLASILNVYYSISLNLYIVCITSLYINKKYILFLIRILHNLPRCFISASKK